MYFWSGHFGSFFRFTLAEMYFWTEHNIIGSFFEFYFGGNVFLNEICWFVFLVWRNFISDRNILVPFLTFTESKFVFSSNIAFFDQKSFSIHFKRFRGTQICSEPRFWSPNLPIQSTNIFKKYFQKTFSKKNKKIKKILNVWMIFPLQVSLSSFGRVSPLPPHESFLKKKIRFGWKTGEMIEMKTQRLHNWPRTLRISLLRSY